MVIFGVSALLKYTNTFLEFNSKSLCAVKCLHTYWFDCVLVLKVVWYKVKMAAKSVECIEARDSKFFFKKRWKSTSVVAWKSQYMYYTYKNHETLRIAHISLTMHFELVCLKKMGFGLLYSFIFVFLSLVFFFGMKTIQIKWWRR